MKRALQNVSLSVSSAKIEYGAYIPGTCSERLVRRASTTNRNKRKSDGFSEVRLCPRRLRSFKFTFFKAV
ncbi:hypothetical protein GJAV_G00240530 [Gymnothorax javanicus]|nr:hypothetical protein GJAV_G00240530 [Gymnothorax javanicus]